MSNTNNDLFQNLKIGNAFSERFGMQCFPAVDKVSGEKYILKICTYPASEVEYAALIQSGLPHEEANNYFKALADDKIAQIQLAEALSVSESFAPIVAYRLNQQEAPIWQVSYLMPYAKTLSTILQKGILTQTEGIKMGIDICTALTRCRKMGMLYLSLKPENIYLTAQGKYQIGEPAFVAFSSLPYFTLPQKYCTQYLPKCCHDCFSLLEENADVYSAGMVLYQTFSGGSLPEVIDTSPKYCDSALSEIILKACHESRALRWSTPEELAFALISYLEAQESEELPVLPLAGRQ